MVDPLSLTRSEISKKYFSIRIGEWHDWKFTSTRRIIILARGGKHRALVLFCIERVSKRLKIITILTIVERAKNVQLPATSVHWNSALRSRLKRGNSDYELCKIKWNEGDKAFFDRPARRATWRWIKQQAHQDYAAGVYSRLVSIRRRLKATFSHDDSLLRYSPDFFTLERSREGACACMRRRERERNKGTVYSSQSFRQVSFPRIF